MKMKSCCNKRTKHREDSEKRPLINRLKRIEGQVRGLQNMLDNDAYCTDIMTQVSAVQSALSSFNIKLLENHLNTCVINDIKKGDDEVIVDLINTIHKLIK